MAWLHNGDSRHERHERVGPDARVARRAHEGEHELREESGVEADDRREVREDGVGERLRDEHARHTDTREEVPGERGLPVVVTQPQQRREEVIGAGNKRKEGMEIRGRDGKGMEIRGWGWTLN